MRKPIHVSQEVYDAVKELLIYRHGYYYVDSSDNLCLRGHSVVVE